MESKRYRGKENKKVDREGERKERRKKNENIKDKN